MSDDGVNTSRRRFLTGFTAAVGAVGVGAVAVPFVGSWTPSAKARAAGAPVKFDTSKLEPGEMKVVEWRGKPVYVVRRTADQVAALSADTLVAELKDPDSEKPQQPPYVSPMTRSIRDEIMVLVGICTHLGCAPKHVQGEAWGSGFFCPCHGSKFDLAGRVYKGVPASANLVVPPYTYETDAVIVIGVDQEAA